MAFHIKLTEKSCGDKILVDSNRIIRTDTFKCPDRAHFQYDHEVWSQRREKAYLVEQKSIGAVSKELLLLVYSIATIGIAYLIVRAVRQGRSAKEVFFDNWAVSNPEPNVEDGKYRTRSYTRLYLTGGEEIDVMETIEEIERMIKGK